MLTQVQATSANGALDPLVMSVLNAANDQLQIRGIEGLGPVKADLPSSAFYGDGEYITGKRVGKRNVVLTLGLSPDWTTGTISDLRQMLYAYFMPKRWVRLEFMTTNLPTVYIEGYVEGVEPNMFAQDPEVQVSVICPRPDFIAVDPTEKTGTMHAAFGTPLIWTYEGTVPTGVILKQTTPSTTFTGELQIKLESEANTHGLIGFTTNIQAARQFLLSTVLGSKYVQEENAGVLLKNLLGYLTTSMEWMQVAPGENLLELKGIPSSGGLLTEPWTLEYNARYGGL